MPSGSPWIDLPDGTGYGNPTRHKSINKLIADIIQHEVQGNGSDSRDVKDMTMLRHTTSKIVHCWLRVSTIFHPCLQKKVAHIVEYC